jgi:hypothetical protein
MLEKQGVVPSELQRLQSEFGQSIRTPFSFATGQFVCQKEKYPPSITSVITPRGEQVGADRLAVYNEQYWYRLLTVLQSDFPLLVASLGFWKFNQLATKYLTLHGSSTPYLENIAASMPDFINHHPDYGSEEQKQMVAVDMAFIRATYMPVTRALNPSLLSQAALERLGENRLAFQPGISLIEEDWNWMEVRIAIATDQLTIPVFMAQKGYWMVSNRNALVVWESLNRLQFLMLQELKMGISLGDACEKFSQTLNALDQEKLMANLAAWFQSWTENGYFQQPSD